MEYVEGESAQDRLKRKGRLDPEEAIAIATHVATALDYGWRKAQLIHRDIKPDNIFLSCDGEVKLGDLGLAKSAGETQSLTMTGSSMGTPHYVSPEQGQGKKDVDLRADIYSLGCTLFHLVSGEAPFKGDTALAVMMQHVTAPVPNLRSVWPECPEELARVVMKMMLKQPAARQQSYGEVITDLRRAYDALTSATMPAVVAVTQQPVAQKQAERQSPAAKPAAKKPVVTKKSPPVAALVGGGLALLAAIAALFWFALWKKGGQLTEAERAGKERTASGSASAGSESGFVPVFGADGLQDWGQNGGAWTYSDGVLAGRLDTKGYARLLSKNPSFADFEIQFSFRSNGKPHFEFRDPVPMPGNAGASYFMLDPMNVRWGGDVIWAGTAVKSISTLKPGRPDLCKQGEWNKVHLLAQGGHLVFSLNETQISDVIVDPAYAGIRSGGIGFCLQNDNNGPVTVEFRSIHIRRITAPGAVPVAPESGFAPLFGADGTKDWKQIGTGATWKFADGVLSCRSDAGAHTTRLRPSAPMPADFEIRFALRSGSGGPGFEFRANQTPGAPLGDCNILYPVSVRTRGHIIYADGDKRLAKAGERVRVTRGGENLVEKTNLHSDWKEGGWNDVSLVVQGNHYVFTCNGVVEAEVFDDPAAHRESFRQFGFRLTNNGDTEVSAEFKDIRIKSLAPGVAQAATPAASASGWISLMDKIDPDADAVKGQWTRVADGMLGDAASGQPGILQLPYEPPEEYDFRIAYTVTTGNPEAIQLLTARGHGFRWTTASFPGAWAGFDNVNGRPVNFSPSGVQLSAPPKIRQRYESLVEVRRDRITGYIDGKKIVEWKTDYSDMSSQLLWALRAANRIGLGIHSSKTTFHDISVREVTGTGKLLRGASPAPAAAVTPATATKDAPFVNALGMNFVPVPGTQVLFSIWDTRVKDYAEYAKANVVDDAWKTQEKDGVPVGRDPHHPVVGVYWEDANAFCRWLTKKESAEGKLPQGMKYRLPTDEEWSRAVGLAKEDGATPGERGQKNRTDYPWGTGFPPSRPHVGNYADKSFHEKFPQEKWMEGYSDGFATTSPVGSFEPNQYGLYDMGGNVWQWVEDLISLSGTTERTTRGASFNNFDGNNTRSSYRLSHSPRYRHFDLGFRCVLGESAR